MIGVPSVDTWHILKELGFQGDLFVGHDPDEPGVTVSIRDTGGPESNPRWMRDTLTVQFWCRSKPEQYAQGYQKIRQIKDLLLGVRTKTVTDIETEDGWGIDVDGTVYVNYVENDSDIIEIGDSIDYIRFLMISDVAFVGQDENNRNLFSLNMEITREERQSTSNRDPIS